MIHMEGSGSAGERSEYYLFLLQRKARKRDRFAATSHDSCKKG